MTEIPDSEKLLGGYLRSYSGLNTRVVGKTPDDLTSTWVKLTQLDADNQAEVTPDYLITFFVQLDCYAGANGGQPEAITLGRKVREALAALNSSNTTLSAGSESAVVTSVRFASHARIPDTDGFEPARERIVIDADVIMHPV